MLLIAYPYAKDADNIGIYSIAIVLFYSMRIVDFLLKGREKLFSKKSRKKVIIYIVLAYISIVVLIIFNIINKSSYLISISFYISTAIYISLITNYILALFEQYIIDNSGTETKMKFFYL